MKIETDTYYLSTFDALHALKSQGHMLGSVRKNKSFIQGELKVRLDEISTEKYKVPSDGTIGKWLKGMIAFKGYFYNEIREYCADSGVELLVVKTKGNSPEILPLDSKASEFVPHLINMNAALIPITGKNRILPQEQTRAKLDVSLFPNTMNYEFVDEQEDAVYQASVSLSGCWLYASLGKDVSLTSTKLQVPITKCGMDVSRESPVTDQKSHIWAVRFNKAIDRSSYEYCTIAHISGTLSLEDHLELLISEHNIRLENVLVLTQAEPEVNSNTSKNIKQFNAKKLIRNSILLSALKRKLAPETSGVLLSTPLLRDEDND